MKIAIVGCGTMGTALAKRLSPFHQLFLYDRNAHKTENLEKEGCGKAFADAKDALKHAEIVILAVKPQNFEEIVSKISQYCKSTILISLLTGTSLQKLNANFPNAVVLRMMPNLALIYGEGSIALSGNKQMDQSLKSQISSLCAPLGKTYWIPENKMNAFTALAGSGPAFTFAIIEAMVEGGIEMGFSAKEAQSLVQQMLKGSLVLLEHHGKHPGELKWQITSAGGTTIAGLRRLEEHAVRSGIINTLLAAYDRAQQLSE